MFSACHESGKFVSCLNEEIFEGNYYCPVCKGKVRAKRGKIMRPHFAHQQLQDCAFQMENESVEHLELKARLFTWASQSQEVIVEAFLPEIQQVADVLVEGKLALEVQCSRLSRERLRERTSAYHSLGMQVIWLLGEKLWLKKSLSFLQKDFLYFSQNLGFYLWELDQESQLLRLKYLLHEDIKGKIHYQVKEFPFDQGDILSILRSPYQQQKVHSFLVPLDQEICHYVRKQLYYQDPKWMKIQETLYQKGENLLTKSEDFFYPQFYPIQDQQGFCQIKRDLTSYYQNFRDYYQERKHKHVQILYPPAYYQAMRQVKKKVERNRKGQLHP